MKNLSIDSFSEFENEAAKMVPESPFETRKLLDVKLYDEPLELEELYNSFENRLSESTRDGINNLISSARHEIQVEELESSTIDEARVVLEERGYANFIAFVSPQTYVEFQDSWARESESPALFVYGVRVLVYKSVPDATMIVMSNQPEIRHASPDSVVVCTCGW